jgi:heptosyltransferase-2
MTKILIISLQGLGNTVLLGSILDYYLKYHNPVQLTLVLSNNGSYQFIKSIHNDSDINYCVWDESKATFRNFLTLIKKLRGHKFDIIFTTFPSAKRENVLSFLLKAKEKRSLRASKGFFRLLQFLNPGKGYAQNDKHDLENNARLFEVPVWQKRKIWDIPNERPIILGIHPGSGARSKRWAIDNYRNLLKKCSETFGCEFVLFGGRNEIDLVKCLQDNNYRAEAFLDRPPFELLDKVCKCHVFIGNDSALIHIANMSGVPVMAIWAYTDFIRVAPYGEGNMLVRKNYNCSPCYDLTTRYIVDCKYHLRCVKDISVDEVYAIMLKWLSILKEGRVPLEHEFVGIRYVDKVERLPNGCMVINLKT